MSWLRLRTRLGQALGSQEDPKLLAASWACGVAVSLSPFLGLHTLLALALALLLRLNKVDVLLGTLLINPWTLPPYWLLAVRVGSWVTGLPEPSLASARMPSPAELWQHAFWQAQEAWLAPLVTNWLVGAGLFATLGGVTAYASLLWLVRWRRRQQAGKHQLA